MEAAAKLRPRRRGREDELGSPYLPGRRTDAWRKIKLLNTQDCVILGWTPGQGGRAKTFGALLRGRATTATSCAGSVRSGPGFTDRMLATCQEQLDPLVRDEPRDRRPRSRGVKGAIFVEPDARLRGRVPRDHEEHGKMRAPSRSRACGPTSCPTSASWSRPRRSRAEGGRAGAPQPSGDFYWPGGPVGDRAVQSPGRSLRREQHGRLHRRGARTPTPSC